MRRLISHALLKVLIAGLIGLILFGIVDSSEAWIGAGLLMLWRLLGLGDEWMRSGQKEPDWELRERELLDSLHHAETPSPEGGGPGEESGKTASPGELAHAQVAIERHTWRPARSRGVLVAETIGLFGFGILRPVVVALYSTDFFEFHRSYLWTDVLVFAGSCALYAAPHHPRFRRTGLMTPWVWWGYSTMAFAALFVVQLSTAHAYLNPFNPDRGRIAAEKVVVMSRWDNIRASKLVGYLTDYAEELARQGEKQKAAALCEHALRLCPGMPEALSLLAKLGAPIPDTRPAISTDAPYFAPGEIAPQATRARLSKELEQIEASTVLLVPMGEVPADILDHVAAVITRELGMPSLVLDHAFALPPHTRRRGLLTSKQWSIESVVKSAIDAMQGTTPQAPVRYLIVTSADMYSGDSNFMFNSAFPWGGIVATAKFEEMEHEDHNRRLMLQRIAKQSLSTMLKSFGIPSSPDRRCVTSYPNCMADVDAKGNRPLPRPRRYSTHGSAR